MISQTLLLREEHLHMGTTACSAVAIALIEDKTPFCKQAWGSWVVSMVSSYLCYGMNLLETMV